MLRHTFSRRAVVGVHRQTRISIASAITRDQPVPTFINALCTAHIQKCPIGTSLRSYATATSTKVAKPRAATKSTKAKGEPKAKKKAAPKKKKKSKAAKPKKKKRKATRPKKAPTALEAQRAKVNRLRSVALLDTPKVLPQTSWTLYVAEKLSKTTGAFGSKTSELAQEFRNLSTSERNNYDSLAAKNKDSNAAVLKQWIEGHTPWEVKVANNARRHLNRIAKEPPPAGAKRALISHRYRLLHDDRSVKNVSTPYIAFTRERWSSGDFKGVSPPEASKSISREWKALSDTEKVKYHDVYVEDKTKYAEEYSRVYGRTLRKKAPKS